MDQINHQLCIPSEHHHQRIDSVLATLLTQYSRSQLSQWIKAGAISVNHKSCKPKDKVAAGDLITMHVNIAESSSDFTRCKPEAMPLHIIYEDDDLLVLNKSAGVVVHPGAGNKEHTLVNALLHYAPSLQHVPRAGIIHRLDKDTTGLLIVAKTLVAHTALIRQMQERTIHRRYLTLVQGHLIAGGTIDTAFGRHPRNRLKMAVTKQGRQAVTRYAINKHYQNYTLLDVTLLTGRTHQIRVHLAHINHPVVGDPLYNKGMYIPTQINEELKNKLLQFKRQALHARSLDFSHPISAQQLTLTAPIPDDLSLLLTTLDQTDELSIR